MNAAAFASTGGCTLFTGVSRPDIPFLSQMVRHRNRSLNHVFKERILLVDTAPFAGNYAGRTDIGSLDQLREVCEQLRADGIIDRTLEVDHSPRQRQLYQRHFSRKVSHTRDHRGIPSIALILAIEEATTDHVLYFDCDVLLHQAPGHDWVAEGVKILRENPDVVVTSPLSGPPSTGALKQAVSYHRDVRGFYSFKTFTARKWLINRDRFNKLLPLNPTYTSWKKRLLGTVTGASALIPWEVAISQRLEQTEYVRADLDSPTAWTLHTPDHGPRFLAALPEIIARVERGWFPPEQAGDYDLRLEAWDIPLP